MIAKWFFCVIVILAAFQTELSNGYVTDFLEEYTDGDATQAKYNYIGTFGGSTWLLVKHMTCSNITSDTMGACTDKVSSKSHYSVAALTISNSHLKTIPNDTFSKAGNLRHLLFENTVIDSLDPSAFVGLTNLRGLHMVGTNIPTVSQETFYGLLNLDGLDLSNNKLGKSLKGTPFANLHTLKTLRLNENSIHEIDSNIFQNLTNLDVLFLQNNLIQKLDSNAFKHAKKLRKLLLSNNSIDEIENGTFSNGLEILDLSFNKLSSLKPEIFTKDPSDKMALTEINVSHNKITFNKSFFSNFPNVRKILLSHNAIEKFSDLETPTADIDISFNKVHRMNNVTFTGFRGFNISNNSLTEFSNLRGPRLQMLFMNNNNLNDNIKEGAFKGFPELKMLRLDSNKITALKDGTFKGLESLTSLNISFNSLDKLNASVFVPLKRLEVLFINGNQLKTIDAQQMISNLPSLKYISFSDNPWTCESIINFDNLLRSTNIEVIHYHSFNSKKTHIIPCTHEEVASEQKTNEQTLNEQNVDEQKPNEQKQNEEKPNEQKPNEQKPNEEKPNEQKPNEQKPNEQKPNEQKPNEQNPNEQNPSEQKTNGDVTTETDKVAKEQTEATKINDSAESKKAQEDMSRQISGLKIAIIVILLALCVGLIAKFVISYRKKTRSEGAPFRNTYQQMESQELL